MTTYLFTFYKPLKKSVLKDEKRDLNWIGNAEHRAFFYASNISKSIKNPYESFE